MSGKWKSIGNGNYSFEVLVDLSEVTKEKATEAALVAAGIFFDGDHYDASGSQLQHVEADLAVRSGFHAAHLIFTAHLRHPPFHKETKHDMDGAMRTLYNWHLKKDLKS